MLKVNQIIKKTINELFENDNEVISKFYKNENIYLIRLYRELAISKSKKIYVNEELYIRNRLHQILNKSLKDLNMFDKIETLLITKCNWGYPFCLFIIKRLKILKKLKNFIQRRDNR